MEVNDIVFEPYEGDSIPFSSIYKLEGYLGSGGFGDVYQVTRLSSGMKMALKVNLKFYSKIPEYQKRPYQKLSINLVLPPL